MRFADTNILLYAISREPAEQAKTVAANDILSDPALVLSTQVLQEFSVQATRASRRDALTHRQAADLVTAFSRFRVQPVTLEVVTLALQVKEQAGLSYWDSAIVAAARVAGCTELLTEDLSHGQDYGGIVASNPFR